MGHDDPILLYGHVFFDAWVHAICVLFFKVEHVLLMSNCVKWLLSFKVHLSICAGVVISGLILSPYNRYYVHFCVPWILEVDSNDLHAGTTNDCVCCFCQLSIHIDTCSIQRP